MRVFSLRTFLIIAVALAIHSHAVASKVLLDAIGRVVDLPNEVRANIVGPDGKTRNVKRGALLFAGDRVEIQGTGILVAVVNMKEREFSTTTNSEVLAGKKLTTQSESSSTYLSKFGYLLERPRRAIPVYSYVRSDNKEEQKILPDSFSPTGIQYLENGTTEVALLWKGGAGILKVITDAGQERHMNSAQRSWVLIPIVATANQIRIEIEGQPVNWNLFIGNTAPWPTWIEEHTQNEDAQKLARALWLLDEGPSTWRVFALSELARLSKAGYFGADQIWRAARSGELTEALQK